MKTTLASIVVVLLSLGCSRGAPDVSRGAQRIENDRETLPQGGFGQLSFENTVTDGTLELVVYSTGQAQLVLTATAMPESNIISTNATIMQSEFLTFERGTSSITANITSEPDYKFVLQNLGGLTVQRYDGEVEETAPETGLNPEESGNGNEAAPEESTVTGAEQEVATPTQEAYVLKDVAFTSSDTDKFTLELSAVPSTAIDNVNGTVDFTLTKSFLMEGVLLKACYYVEEDGRMLFVPEEEWEGVAECYALLRRF